MKKYFLVLLLSFLSMPLFLNSTKAAFIPEVIIPSGITTEYNGTPINYYWTRYDEKSPYFHMDLDGAHTFSNGLLVSGDVFTIVSTNLNYRYLTFNTPNYDITIDIYNNILSIEIIAFVPALNTYYIDFGTNDTSTLAINDGSFKLLSNNLQGQLNYEVYSKGFDDGKYVGLEDGSEIGFIEGYNAGLLQSQNESYNSGYAEGSLDGFNEGYFLGLNDPENPEYDVRYDMGFNSGYAEGVSAQLDDDVSGFFGSIFSFIGGIFNTQIFPGLTIGLLASIPIMLAVLRWFFMSLGKKD
ncbi:MAG: hypothetical protein QXI16_03160 [Sulfolobaceae archaeon]